MITSANLGLSEECPYYRSKVQIYDYFSQKEDIPHYVDKFLKDKVFGKKVLDLGCGTGKYISLLAPYCGWYFGLDRASEAITLARYRAYHHKNVSIIEANAEDIPIPDRSIDCIYACWVLGTILDKKRRAKVVKECRRVLRPEGEIFLIENGIGGEFEYIRQRFPEVTRSEEYLNELVSMGFSKDTEFNSYFEFSSIQEAQTIFGMIWGEEALKRVSKNKIEQKINIYYYYSFRA